MTTKNTEVTTITIPLVEYISLVDDSRQLTHLEINGVESWIAYSRYDADNNEDETAEDYLRYNDEN